MDGIVPQPPSSLTTQQDRIIDANESCLHTSNNTQCEIYVGPQEIPRALTFTDDSLMSVLSYTALFVVAATGNLTVFVTLCRHRRKSRVNWFIMHLAIADMIVTFVMMPLEVAWHLTVSWMAGDFACRFLMFCRVFGFYLSSFILIVICLDRYYAISHPMSLTDAERRGKVMVGVAWMASIVSSIPQSVIFHVESHPSYPWFHQCVTFNFFPSPAHELAYNLFNLMAMYLIPLGVIIITYSLIFWEIYKRSKYTTETSAFHHCHNGREQVTSIQQRIRKAKIRTLKMTVVIIIVFVACWTPYFVISAWWWISKSSARELSSKVQRILFIFAVSNSCVNPIVYGMYTKTFKFKWRRILRNFECCKTRDVISSFDISTPPLHDVKNGDIPLQDNINHHGNKRQLIAQRKQEKMEMKQPSTHETKADGHNSDPPSYNISIPSPLHWKLKREYDFRQINCNTNSSIRRSKSSSPVVHVTDYSNCGSIPKKVYHHSTVNVFGGNSSKMVAARSYGTVYMCNGEVDRDNSALGDSAYDSEGATRLVNGAYSAYDFSRKVTPPHIAIGRGITDSCQQYVFH